MRPPPDRDPGDGPRPDPRRRGLAVVRPLRWPRRAAREPHGEQGPAPLEPRASAALSDADRAWLLARLSSRLTTEGDLLVASERHREQGRNVEDALLRLATILRTALRRPRPRKATRPTRASKERRLDAKKRRSESKRGRRPPSDG